MHTPHLELEQREGLCYCHKNNVGVDGAPVL